MDSDSLLESLLKAPDAIQRRDFLAALSRGKREGLIARLKERADAVKRDDPQQALFLGKIAGEIAETLGDEAAQARAYWIQASAYHMMGDHRSAASYYQQAMMLFRSSGRMLDAARVSVGYIGSLTRLEQYEEAHWLAEWADSILAGDALSHAKITLNLGNIHSQKGEYPRALEYYREAREAFQSCGESLYEAMTKVNEANALSWLGYFRQAEQLYLEARAVFEQAGWKATLATVDYNLADMRYGCGEYSQALQTCECLRDLLQELRLETDIAYLERLESAIYLDLNLADKALQHATAAVQVFDRAGMNFEKGWALIHCGIACARLGQDRQALSWLTQARDLFTAQGNEVWAAHADLQRAELLIRQGRVQAALTLLREVVSIYQLRGLVLNQAYGKVLMARLYLESNWPEQALSMLTATEDALGEIRPPWLIHRMQTLYGAIYEALGDRERAYQAYRFAAEIVEGMAVTLPVEEHRMAFISDKAAPYEGLVFLLAGQNTAEAFAWVERAKSRALLEHLTAEVRPRSSVQDSPDRRRFEQLRSLRQELNWLYTRLLHGTGPKEENRKPDPQMLWQEIQRRERAIAELWRDLDARYTESLSLQHVLPVAVEPIQAALPANTALLEYFLGRERLLVFVVTRQEIRVFPLTVRLSQLRPLLEELTFHLSKFYYGAEYYQRHQNVLQAFVQDRLSQLYDFLLAPLGACLEAFENLIIIPHGILHALPFHALYHNGQYLIERKAISYAPSAAVLQFCWQKDIPLADRPALFVGVPRAGLEFVEQEVRKLSACWPQATALLGEEATLERLRSLSPKYGLIHLAAHGLFRPDVPLLSGVQLADGWLAAKDVYEMELRAGLITLSACESGCGRVSGGDEVIGLARSFLYAGAASLLVSLWMVHDEAMTFLMEKFYRALAGGLSRSRALQYAQQEALARYHHPYFWAPLILIGSEGRVSASSSSLPQNIQKEGVLL